MGLRRPELFVPLSVRFVTGKTGSRLLERFGRDGLLVWAAYLAACKLHRPEGEIHYASEAEGWALLGLSGYEPEFTLDEFFAFTGKLRKTRRTKSGRVSYVKNQAWERWTKVKKQEDERQRKTRSRAQSTRDIHVTPNGQERDLEVEVDIETPLPPFHKNPQPRTTHPHRCPVCGNTYTNDHELALHQANVHDAPPVPLTTAELAS